MEPEMTYTETDPKLVRELAEAAFRNDVNVGSDRAERVEAALIASGVASPVLGEKFDAWSKAVGAECDRLAAAADGATATPAMSDERLAHVEWILEADASGVGGELLAEVKRAREREAALVDEVDEQVEQLRRMAAELARSTGLNRDLVAENTNLADALKEAREQIRDRDYVNANLRKTVKEYRARQAEAGEVELEWGVRATVRATGGTEDSSQPSEASARARVARSSGGSVLICRTKAGQWHEAGREA